ncbi:MAG: hypothetical protein AAF317_08595 [Pseudomonadota bacterium]
MNLIYLIVGIFCGIGVCMGTLYSVAQVILLEGYRRWVHFAAVVVMLTVMWFLLEREAQTAQILSPILLMTCAAAIWVEHRWFKILPALQGVFASVLFAGYVQF